MNNIKTKVKLVNLGYNDSCHVRIQMLKLSSLYWTERYNVYKSN